MALCLALSAGYSYSEPYIYGTTTNVADTYVWNMSDYLPDDPVIDINAVIYHYTTVKNTEDDMLVHVQNKSTLDDSYIFRETDDWSGLPSGSINKFVPVPNIDANLFGEGSIEVEGNGQVTGQVVQYNYRIDTAVASNTDIVLPDTNNIDIYNVLEDDAVSSDQADVEYTDEEKQEQEERKKKGIKAASQAVGIGSTAAQLAMMNAMMSVNIDSYYSASIDGGTYKETVSLTDTKLPENKRGLRNGLAQQILHSKMVDEQYNRR